MSITLTPKQSSLFRRMSQGRKHDPTFKPSLSIMQQEWRHTQFHTHTHSAQLSKRFHQTQNTTSSNIRITVTLSALAIPSPVIISSSHKHSSSGIPSIRLGKQITYQYLCCLSPPPPFKCLSLFLMHLTDALASNRLIWASISALSRFKCNLQS